MENTVIDNFLAAAKEASSTGLEHIHSQLNDTLGVKGDGIYEIEEFYQKSSLFDDKQYTRFIKSVEKLVRTSQEYKTYIGYLHNTLGLNQCAIMSNITGEIADIEIDHYPFTLYDYCQIVLEKYIATNVKHTTFMVANEVLKMHYDHIVGLVPLTKTIHELRHAGKIFIDIRQVYGNLILLDQQYGEWIDKGLKAKLARAIEMSKENTSALPAGLLEYRTQNVYEGGLIEGLLLLSESLQRSLGEDGGSNALAF